MEKADIDFLIDLATRFYVLGQTQARIARDLDVDPATVSRHLKKARDEGIVRVEIRRPRSLHIDLGRELAECYGIKRAVVVANEDGGISAVAAAAADYFSSILTNGARLGLSFGRMLSAMVPLLPAGIVSELDISMLLGGFGRAMPGIQGHELARHITSLYQHSRIHYLQAPLLVDSPDIRQAMMRDGSIRAALEAAANTEMALVGIGNLADTAPLIRYGHLSVEDQKRLLQSGAVGDVSARFFNIHGEPVSVLDDRLIAIDRENLARIPTVIAVAAGPEKYAAIQGALRTGYVNVLITDESTAQELVRAAHKKSDWAESKGGKAV
ncbi:MAG TPA: sugar-binding domain-containing protein [Ktedonobacteraceae bacterium]|nr:sugar-binding domain-containing protein [Ktedonobacteraceae bacterium]